MTNEKDDGRRRKQVKIWLYTERWLLSSTRFELRPAERSVWVDFLSVASFGGGQFTVPARTEKGKRPIPEFSLLAKQLDVPIQLLYKCLDLFLTYAKVSSTYLPLEKKFLIKILKWEQYQTPYLHDPQGKPERENKKQDKKTRSVKDVKNDAQNAPRSEVNRSEVKRNEKEYDTEHESASIDEAEEPKSIEDRPAPEYVPKTIIADILKLKTEIRDNRERLQHLKEENANQDEVERYERIVEKGRKNLQQMYEDAKRKGDE